MEFADGRRASNLGSWWEEPTSEDQAVLSAGSGSGGDLDYDGTYWVSPLPPDGPFTLVCAWPAFGLPEVRRTVSEAAFTSAGAQATVLWPSTPDPGPRPHPEPPRPATGWFADPGGAR